MTEISETNPAVSAASFSPAMERFILHWGDMGGSWGVNRSVAQIHALLLVQERPLHAEEIAGLLGMARSNVSTSLKDLVAWDLVRRVPIRGDRRDHFEAEGDVWEMVFRIIEMRKAREIDPAKSVLSHCLDEARGDPQTNEIAVKRLSDIKELMDVLDGWYGQVKSTPKETLLPLIRMGSKAVDLLKLFLKKKEGKGG
ncbi:GbsR/MarR family transcriptional regulator [Hyphococcus sp.]|uniref:GbsR/MarR family transcriptional regulator n=1 Tax=Hyphococcus sp. TaxID=2038636 RepID=UPI003CCBED13